MRAARPLSSRRPLVAATALLALLAALARPSVGQEPEAEAAAGQEREELVLEVEDAASTTVTVDLKRVALPSLSHETDHPFTIEIPVSWTVRRDLAAVGLFLGPPGGDPNSHPEMLLVQQSEVALGDPDTTLAILRGNAQAAPWSLREAEVRDFGGVEGLWIVRDMPPAGLHGERVSYAAKLPLERGSLNVLATVPAEQNEALEPTIRHMLQSIRPVEPEAAERQD